MAVGSMKDIKRRIKSVESTGQITKAMELVASSKLRKAKERAQMARPYFETLYQTMCDISSLNNDFTSEYVCPREVKTTLLVIIAGDRGLAGGYNSNIFKLAESEALKKQKSGKQVKIIAIGKKACEHYEKSSYDMVNGFPSVAEDLDQLRVAKISDIVTSLYLKGEIDEAFLYYTQFVSALSQIPTEIKMLPILDIKEERKEGVAMPFVEYEPSPQEVFDAIVPPYISGTLYGAVVESFAAEQGARRTAMESASDNAQEMIDALSLQYNRARQATITNEISEIVSGSIGA